MGHPLQATIRGMAQRCWWLVFLWNGVRYLAVIMLAGLLVGAVDYGLRIQDVGLRWILAACFWLVFAGAFWRFLWPALCFRCSDLYVARRIESCFPGLGQRLSSSIAFLELPMPSRGAGSRELREAVIESAAQELDGIDMRKCLEIRGLWRAVALMALVLALIVACFTLNSTGAVQATGRLARPWRHAPWPRWNRLQLVDPPPLKVATGASFRIQVKDTNQHLPGKVVLQYRAAGDLPEEQQTLVMDQEGGNAHYRFNNLQRSIQFRVIGGDDDTMPWNYVTVIDPVRVEQLHLTLRAPSYLDWPDEKVEGAFRAVEGSKICLEGRLDRSAKRVTLVTEEENRRYRRALVLSEDKQRFVLDSRDAFEWVLQGPCRYWIEAEDDDGLVGVAQTPWEIRVVTDIPPSVVLQLPRQQHQVLPGGRVVMEIGAEDDFALQQMELHFQRADGDGSARQAIVLWKAGGADGTARITGFRGPGPVTDRRRVKYAWDLATVEGIDGARVIDYQLRVTDSKGQVAETPVNQVELISRADLEQEMLRRQAQVVSRLKETLHWQEQARRHAKELQDRLEGSAAYRKSDLDHMQSIELNQRQVGQSLSSDPLAIPAEVREVLTMIKDNRVSLPDLVRQLDQLLETLGLIHQRELVSLESRLVGVLKTARADWEAVIKDQPADRQESLEVPVNREVRLAWNEVTLRQQSVIDMLHQLLGRITEQEDYRRFSHEVRRVADSQFQYLQQAQRLQAELLTQPTTPLPELVRVQQGQWADRQIALARQLERVLQRMRQMRERIRETDKGAAGILADALTLARDQALTGQMRQSGAEIQRNQLGRAIRMQDEIHTGLQQMLQVLGNRHVHQLDQTLDQLEIARNQLSGLRASQRALESRMQEIADEPRGNRRRTMLQESAETQQQIMQGLDQLEALVQQLGVDRAREAFQLARQQMKRVGEALGQDEPAQGVDASHAARQQLTEVQRWLQQGTSRIEDDLLREQLAQLKVLLQSFLQRQELLLTETAELHDLRQVHPGKRLTRVQRGLLKGLAEQQRLLAAEGDAAVEGLRQSDVFRAGIQFLVETMNRAAHGLEEEATGPMEAQSHQREAARQVRQLVQALESKSPQVSPGRPDSPETPVPSGKGTARSRGIAELVLLQLMQVEINRETERLDKIRLQEGTWAPRHKLRYRALAKKQGQLAKLIEGLRTTVVDEGTDRP